MKRRKPDRNVGSERRDPIVVVSQADWTQAKSDRFWFVRLGRHWSPLVKAIPHDPGCDVSVEEVQRELNELDSYYG